MRSRTLLAALAALAASAGMAATTSPAHAAPAPVITHVNGCWSTDNGPAVLDSVHLSRTAADVSRSPAVVRVVLKAHDTGGPGPATGIATVRLETPLPMPRQTPGVVPMHRSHGHWSASVTIPRGWSDGGLGGNFWIGAEAIDRGGKASELVVDRSVAVTDRHPDEDAPVLKKVSLSTHRINTTRHAHDLGIVVTAEDSGAGISKIVFTDGTQDGAFARLERIGHTHRFRGDLRIERWRGDARSGVHVSLVDRLNNQVSWTPQQLRLAGSNPDLHIVSGPLDDHPPRLVRTLQVTRHVDIRRHSKSVTVRVLLADNHEVHFVRILTSGDYGARVLHRVSGTERRGVWRAVIPFRKCGQDASSAKLLLTMDDAVENVRWAHLGRVSVREHDRRAFIVGPPFPGPLDFRFNEPVHGISAAHVLVLDSGGDAVPGSWSCTAKPTAPVDCLTGQVRRATFTPDPGAPGDPASVDWEPDGQLNVLDDAGNPAHALVTYLPPS